MNNIEAKSIARNLNTTTEILSQFNQFVITTDFGARVNGYIDDGEVFYIYVPESYRRQGIATALLIKVKELVKKEIVFTKAISLSGQALIDNWNEMVK